MIPLLVEKIRINWFPWDSQLKSFEAVQSREWKMSQKLHLKCPGNVSFEESPMKCQMNAHSSAFSALLTKATASYSFLVILRCRRPRKCSISAVVWSPFFWHAKTRIWSFTFRSKVTTINAPLLWWPNWYMTRSRPFLHYPVTNKCGAGPNRCWQQQPCCRSPSGKPFGCVLQANNHLQQRCQIHKQNFC